MVHGDNTIRPEDPREAVSVEDRCKLHEERLHTRFCRRVFHVHVQVLIDDLARDLERYCLPRLLCLAVKAGFQSVVSEGVVVSRTRDEVEDEGTFDVLHIHAKL